MGRDEPVLNVVDVRRRAERRVGRRPSLPLRIMAERRRARGRILVEAVGGIVADRGGSAAPGISIVARRAALVCEAGV